MNTTESALDESFPEVYDELRRLAAQALKGERSNHTLQPTALVHEAYLRLDDEDAGPQKIRDEGTIDLHDWSL